MDISKHLRCLGVINIRPKATSEGGTGTMAMIMVVIMMLAMR